MAYTVLAWHCTLKIKLIAYPTDIHIIVTSKSTIQYLKHNVPFQYFSVFDKSILHAYALELELVAYKESTS